MPFTSIAAASRLAGQILSHTPPVVWALLALLVALGLAQTRERRMTVTRATVLPLAMMALSLWGTASLFGHAHLLPVTASWLGAAAMTFATVGRTAPPRAAAFDAATLTLVLPGTWAPLGLMLAVFALRYATNVALALHPELAVDTLFAMGVAIASGLLTGAFGGRSARLWKLIEAPAPALPPAWTHSCTVPVREPTH